MGNKRAKLHSRWKKKPAEGKKRASEHIKIRRKVQRVQYKATGGKRKSNLLTKEAAGGRNKFVSVYVPWCSRRWKEETQQQYKTTSIQKGFVGWARRNGMGGKGDPLQGRITEGLTYRMKGGMSRLKESRTSRALNGLEWGKAGGLGDLRTVRSLGFVSLSVGDQPVIIIIRAFIEDTHRYSV